MLFFSARFFPQLKLFVVTIFLKVACILSHSILHLYLLANTTKFGRGPECNVRFNDMHVSKVHFIIDRVKKECGLIPMIYDMSSNGTRLNGVVIGKGNHSVLNDRDEISVYQMPNGKQFTYFYKKAQPKVEEFMLKYIDINKIVGRYYYYYYLII